jgi:transposase
MFSLTSSQQYYLYRGFTDMRKSFDGLCGLVQNHLQHNATSGEVFLFINRRRDKIKLLHWEPGGFVLYYKRLESGTFELPQYDPDKNHCLITWSDLVMMIDGIRLGSVQKRKRFSN